MIYINLEMGAEVEGAGSLGLTRYIPVPVKGVVRKVVTVQGHISASSNTVTLYRDSTAVNAVTVAASGTAGTIDIGTPDTTNADLVFDPDSSTDAYKMIKVVMTDSGNTIGGYSICIHYDDFALTDNDSTF